jgi:hypothetical protein
MNLVANPSIGELRELLSNADDDAGTHVLWVDQRGNVHLEALAELTPAAWGERNEADIRLQYESFQRGNGYVGPKAAKDDAWVSRLFQSLSQQWKSGASGFIDYF